MTILIRNSPVHIYKGPLPTHEINESNPQTMTRVNSYYCTYFTTQKDARVSVYKSHKKSKETLLLAKRYESKNINVGIIKSYKYFSR